MVIGLENEVVEFKESLGEKEEAMKDMGAMLNKRGAGTLYFGINDNGYVVGLEVGKKTESDLASKINSSIEPVPFYFIDTKEDATGKKFIEVRFHGEAKPYRAKGAYYLRNGERSDLMPTSLLSEMLIQSQKSYDDWENSSSEASLEMMDENLIKRVVETGNKLNRLSHPYVSVEDALSFLHLINATGHINKAGEALFSKDRPINCRLSVLGDCNGETFLDMQRVSGNIFELIDMSFNYVMSKLDYKASFDGKGIERKMEEEIPSLAIRELIVNAFGHAYYKAPFTQDIAVYPNRVSFYSPGPFPSNGKPEDFAKKLIKPVDKNDRINSVLYFCNYIEHFGTGFTKIMKALAEKKITYRYQNLNGGFLFEIFRPNKICISDPSLSLYQKALEVMKQDSYVSLDKLASVLEVSKATVSRIIRSLKESSKIERKGSDKNGRWILI